MNLVDNGLLSTVYVLNKYYFVDLFSANSLISRETAFKNPKLSNSDSKQKLFVICNPMS